ncbi:MAG TPA: phosphatidylserine/phosphatidylglycerophosphate/cardiolipin synthase family protein, partial [Kofleriaceae bacterium]
YLVADGQRAILGGMNVADEYLFGGDPAHPEPIVDVGVARPAWRDTDVLIEGPAAADAYQAFARNWLTLTGEVLPPPPPAMPVAGDAHVQIVQHRPGEDGDHHTAAVLIEALATLEAGQRALISSAYFLPTAALTQYRHALACAARRGVDVRVLTNSRESTDEPAICDAAVYPCRELVAAGVKLFERTTARTMHQKVAVLGGNTCIVGSWNSDNRSETFNSEVMAVICSEELARQMEAQFEADCCVDGAEPCARPILAAQLEHHSHAEAWRSLWAALQAELL